MIKLQIVLTPGMIAKITQIIQLKPKYLFVLCFILLIAVQSFELRGREVELVGGLEQINGLPCP